MTKVTRVVRKAGRLTAKGTKAIKHAAKTATGAAKEIGHAAVETGKTSKRQFKRGYQYEMKKK